MRWKLEEGWDSRAAFDKVLLDLDKTSSPGYPLLREATTVGQWLRWEFDRPNATQAERLWCMVRQVLGGTYHHIFRAFVKDEPHKKAKADEGRWRLIIASSLPVLVVWRMAFGTLNDLLNESVYSTPSMHGLVLCYGGWRRFLALCRLRNLKVARDLSGWDVNSPGWVFRADLELRKRLCDNPTPYWESVVDMLYRDTFEESEILFSNGLVYKQKFSGFMKSGCFNTISTNSIAMYLMHVVACVRSRIKIGVLYAVGDDTIQEPFPDCYLDELEKLGCRVKEVVDGVEFVGTDFRNSAPEPMYFAKHVVNVCITEEVEDTIDSYCRLYAHSPKLAFWKRLAQRMGLKVRSSAFYQAWYDCAWARWCL